MVLSTMKDPYMFDFIDYTEEMLETDIENELVKNVTSLLMELGTGFAFMGQQYHLEVGGKDFYIDLLFYNTKLRCYVAIDLKTGEFKPEQAGKEDMSIQKRLKHSGLKRKRLRKTKVMA